MSQPEVVPLGPVRPEPGARAALGALLTRRRSTRAFGPRPLDLTHVALLAWAAQGRTTGERRACPSAHALHPLTLTLVAGDVDGLAAGAYRYDATRDALTLVAAGDHRDRVAATTLVDHAWLRYAAVLLLLSGDLETAARHFADQPPLGRRGERYVWLEAGHASQNVYLQAAESGLGAVLVAGFHDDRLRELAPPPAPPLVPAGRSPLVPAGQHPLALLGVGHPADAPPEGSAPQATPPEDDPPDGPAGGDPRARP